MVTKIKWMVIIVVLIACEHKNNNNLNFFRTYLKKIGYSTEFIDFDSTSLYLFRSDSKYFGTSIIKLSGDQMYYFSYDEKKFYFDNQRLKYTYFRRTKNPTIQITKLNVKYDFKKIKLYKNQFSKHKFNNVNQYRNYTIYSPKLSKIVTINSKYPINNYSKEEWELLNWIKNIYCKISVNEEIFYNTFMDKSYQFKVDSLLLLNPKYFEKSKKKYFIPINDDHLFFTGSIYDTIGKYD